LSCISCQKQQQNKTPEYSKLEIEVVVEDSISIRALEIYKDTLVGFGYNKGYGFLNLNTNKVELHEFIVLDSTNKKKNWIAQQRAVAFTDHSFFSFGIGSPARLRKIDLKSGAEKVVYIETHVKAFYDAISFWNTNEGIAMGDPTEDCLSIIVTRDGGESWDKIPCDDLPETVEGEAAFAASNGNIAIIGDHTWIISGGMKSRVFYSADKARTWDVFDTPIIQGSQTTGGYSIHFTTPTDGVVYGGDYTKPNHNIANKAITKDAGRTWQLIADSLHPGYKSSVRYMPKTTKSMIAVGFTGISVSNDYGAHWSELSKEGFYTLRFINDSTAMAAGKGRIAKIRFE